MFSDKTYFSVLINWLYIWLLLASHHALGDIECHERWFFAVNHNHILSCIGDIRLLEEEASYIGIQWIPYNLTLSIDDWTENDNGTCSLHTLSSDIHSIVGIIMFWIRKMVLNWFSLWRLLIRAYLILFRLVLIIKKASYLNIHPPSNRGDSIIGRIVVNSLIKPFTLVWFIDRRGRRATTTQPAAIHRG